MMDARILLLPGDGVGAEVVDAGRRVLEAADERWGLDLEFTTGLIGGAAIASPLTTPSTTNEFTRAVLEHLTA